MKQAQLYQYMQMLANDMDQIKHQTRGALWRINALLTHFQINIQPDILEETLNPSAQFLNQIIQEARFVDKDKPMPRRKPRRAQKRRRVIPKRDFRKRKHK